ncbi:Uncharacterised protein [Serratia fonticola]|uniref:hypothetical protein n=1 Tax=Serratia fonticola TaxID=47917 RepID=UPI00217B4C58|nr:hypothetical protein [Serratia fonticola]CAI2040777.1 Uncharacterised protein [Serratia fonticola]
MTIYNLVTPRHTIVVSQKIEMELSDTAKRLLKQLTRYHEGLAILNRIKIGVEYFVPKLELGEWYQMETMECGLIVLYCSLFTEGLHLPDSLIDEKFILFHKDIMELRNRYYCHSDSTGKVPLLNLHVNNGVFCTSIAFESSLRFLDKINIQWFERNVDNLISVLNQKINETEVSFNKALTQDETDKLMVLTNLDEHDRMAAYIELQTVKLKNYLSPKPRRRK